MVKQEWRCFQSGGTVLNLGTASATSTVTGVTSSAFVIIT
jgi:hypothetical protein